MNSGRTLKILHAGALRKPLKMCAQLFKNSFSDIEISLDYAGSRSCARALLEGQDADVIALADPHVFEDLLVPDHVDIFFVFATDRMVLAYDEFSRYSSVIEAGNWYDILSREGVLFARSDQNLDPCGYRALMLWKLAEDFYSAPGLFDRLNGKCGEKFIYPKSIDLSSALLEGRVDYVFSYSSVAEQFGFRYINFPDRINLSNPVHADFYSRAEVELAGKNDRVSAVKGAPIEFAVAVPKSSSNKDMASSFIRILTSSQGERILESCGLIPC